VLVPHHVGDLHIFVIHRGLVREERQRRLTVVVGALPFDVLMGMG
jgi:hypothetical protein